MMNPPLSARDLLRLWERAEAQVSGQARALLLLDIVQPGTDWETLSRMSVGRRDQRLLALRERQLGKSLQLFGECPACGQAVELDFSTRDLAAAGANVGEYDQDRPLPYRMEQGDMVVDFRLPNSVDLDAAGLCDDVEGARQLLLDRCVLGVTAPDGKVRRGSDLSLDVQQALEREMERLDPLAVVQLNLDCPACSRRWQVGIDVPEIILSELATQARRLLREVSTLARHYHWSEESILAMTARRRDAYLELSGT